MAIEKTSKRLKLARLLSACAMVYGGYLVAVAEGASAGGILLFGAGCVALLFTSVAIW